MAADRDTEECVLKVLPETLPGEYPVRWAYTPNLAIFRMPMFYIRKIENFKEIPVPKLLFDRMAEDGDTVECVF